MRNHKSDKIEFVLPEEGIFEQGGPDDPLPFYYKPLTGRLYTGRIKCGLSLLSPPYQSVLDVGYGSGILLPTLARVSRKLTAIDRDTDPAPIVSILEKLGIQAELLKADIVSEELPENSFDLIVAFSVLEEVKDIKAVIGAMIRLLKPGGDLLVGIPRVDGFMELLFRLIGYHGIEEEHVRTYKDILSEAQKGNKMFMERFKIYPRFFPLYYAALLRKIPESKKSSFLEKPDFYTSKNK